MNIARDKEHETEIYDAVKAYLNKTPRTGIHVSDLLMPRITFFRRIDPRPMTDDEAGYFVAGRGHHELLEVIIDPRPKKKKGSADGGTYEWEGIQFSPDVQVKGAPGEFKTSRAKYGPKDDDPDTLKEKYKLYLKQLLSYMALQRKTDGKLIVLYLSMKEPKEKRTTPKFRSYHVTITPEEIEQIRGKLLEAKAKLERAIETNNHRELTLCPEWKCFGCPWRRKCEPENGVKAVETPALESEATA